MSLVSSVGDAPPQQVELQMPMAGGPEAQSPFRYRFGLLDGAG